MRYPFGFLWIVFAVMWIFWPQELGDIYDWIVALPVILEILVWIVFLPWVGALFISQAALALWLKIVVIIGIAVVTTGGVSARRSSRRPARAWTQRTGS